MSDRLAATSGGHEEAASGAPAVHTAGRPEPRPDRTPERGGAVGDVLAVVGTSAVLGAVCGALWWLLVDPAVYTKLNGEGVMDPLELAKRFDGDAWYSVIAAVAGVLLGGTLTWWRARDFRLTTVLLVVGAGVAAAVMAWVGQVLGPGDPAAALEAAQEGDTVPVQLTVTATAAYLVWPIATLVGALLVLWSPPKDEIR